MMSRKKQLSRASGAEKSGKNAEGDSWWEKWKEVLYQDKWRSSIRGKNLSLKGISCLCQLNCFQVHSGNLARIERSAEEQAKSGAENAGLEYLHVPRID